MQWLRGRALDCQLRESGFESCSAMLQPWASFFTLHCSSSIGCINEYLAIDRGGYVYKQPSHINCSMWIKCQHKFWMYSVGYSHFLINTCIYIHICRQTHTHTHTSVHIHTNTSTYTQINAHTCTSTHKQTHT